MVRLAMLRIRRAYITITSNALTHPPVKCLTDVLLEDSNNRYEPADYTGRVRYTDNADIGHYKMDTGVHP